MAQEELAKIKSENELDQIIQHISNGNHFLLSGGAGSGKTYTLVQVIRRVIEKFPISLVACITYTNAAVHEIDERVNHKNLRVSTIHDFLWDNIKHFQSELKETLVELINDDLHPNFKISGQDKISNTFYNDVVGGVQYKEYLKLSEAIISHDELVVIAHAMFTKYKKLCDILTCRYPFIFVDEYQDTHKEVVQILLDHLRKSASSNVVGFFGDAMQSIYDDGIGNLDPYKGDGEEQVREVKKEQNRRNPKLIIDLANKLRTDGLLQIPSDDVTAPNMVDGVIKSGDIKFLYSVNPTISNVRDYLGWDFANSSETKELNLTHNLIAAKAGFADLVDIYDRDQLLAYRDRIKKYIKDYDIKVDFTGKAFGEVIDILKDGKIGPELNKVSPTTGMRAFIELHPQLFETAKLMDYTVFSKMYVDKDQLLDDKKQNSEDVKKKGSKRDELIRHLFKIQNNILLYNESRFNEFIKATDIQVCSIEDKKNLKNNIENLVNTENKTIGEIIELADSMGICRVDDRLTRFKENSSYIYHRVCSVSYSVFQNLYFYLEGFTPFSTQHKTKGAEFKNVLVVLDNGRWNNFNFEYLFTGAGTESVLTRTQKIFYVCCTRAKDNLAVFYHQPTEAIINKAKEWFGENNTINIDAL